MAKGMAVKKKRSSSASAPKAAARKAKPAARKPAASAGKRATPKAVGKSSGKASARTQTKTKARTSGPVAKKVSKKAPAQRKAGAKPGKSTGATAVRRPETKTTQVKRNMSLPRRTDTGPIVGSVGLIHGIPPYQSRPGEAYMNDRQREHFRNILLAWKRELMEGVDRTVHHMQDEASNFPDPNDRATQESEFGLELRTRDRERKLLKKIDSALERIEDGSYGYCEETGEEIGLKRLEARPVATLSVEAQERREVAERQYRDREDGF